MFISQANYMMGIFGKFQKWSPEIINKMRECSHHFDSENLNPFHMESDVWCHTVLMYKNFMDDFLNNRPPYNNFIEDPVIGKLMPIIILCHDIGKIYTRHIPRGEYGKVAFYNHSFASVQPTIDFIKYLNENIYSSNMYSILNVISNHMDYFKSDENSKYLLSNYNDYNYALGKIMNYLDHKNSMDLNLNFLNYNIDNIEFVELFPLENLSYKTDVDVHMYCGCPGSGKDYLAEKEVGNVVSYDKIREDIYIDRYPDRPKHVSKAQLYKEAWEYCNEKNINLNQILYQRVGNFIENGEEVAICNTNLTRKARRTIAGLFQKYKIGVKYVTASSKTLHKRNNSRNSKNLDRMVMNKFMYNQQVPSLFDFKDQRNVKYIEMEYNE